MPFHLGYMFCAGFDLLLMAIRHDLRGGFRRLTSFQNPLQPIPLGDKQIKIQCFSTDSSRHRRLPRVAGMDMRSSAYIPRITPCSAYRLYLGAEWRKLKRLECAEYRRSIRTANTAAIALPRSRPGRFSYALSPYSDFLPVFKNTEKKNIAEMKIN
jgi:hypothetical protein